MARTSKNYHKPEIEQTMKTALYARISVTSEASSTSVSYNSSIENQVALMMSYIKDKPGFKLVKTYIDTNVSGATFSRPAFSKIMQDIRNGIVNCVIVKDVSRFGRNYIETGNYLENVFSFLNVRFISVNEKIDSFATGVDLNAQLKSILGDSQRKYISQATQSSLVARAKLGKLLLPNAPYGYKRESDGEFTVNEAATIVVRQIFALAAEGISYVKIAKILNDSGVPTRSGGSALWAQSTIGQILKNRAYLGEESCKIGNELFERKNAHPAIFTEEEFNSAQHIGNHRKQNIPHRSSLLIGKVACAECGRSMIRYSYNSGGKIIAAFQCRTSTVISNASCFKGAVLEADIEAMLQQKVLCLTEGLRKRQTELKDLLIKKSIFLRKCESETKEETVRLKTELTYTYNKLHSGEMKQADFNQYYQVMEELIANLKERESRLDTEYKELYEEYLEMTNRIKRLRLCLSAENFSEQFLRENDLSITISKSGNILVKI